MEKNVKVFVLVVMESSFQVKVMMSHPNEFFFYIDTDVETLNSFLIRVDIVIHDNKSLKLTMSSPFNNCNIVVNEKRLEVFYSQMAFKFSEGYTNIVLGKLKRLMNDYIRCENKEVMIDREY